MRTDLNLAFRSLARSPGFTFVALVTLALGIGLNTSMFSVMNHFILRPLPYPDVDRLVRIHRTTPQDNGAQHSASDYLELARESAPFAQLAAYRMWGYTLALEGRPPVNLNGLRVSASFLTALGLAPQHGRVFTLEEDVPGNNVAILSFATWQAQFGGDPSVVGRMVRIDGQPTMIVGIMPESFSTVTLWGPAEVLRPLGLGDLEKLDRTSPSFRILARHAPDLTLAQLDARLRAIATRLAEARPRERKEDGLRAVSFASTAVDRSTIGLSWFLVAVAGFVLLIACANLANVQLARAVARAHEYAIRAALGASRARLLRPLLVESVVLALAGGLLGILVAFWTNDWISARLSVFVAFDVGLDWRVLAFAMGASLATGVAFGVVPAWLVSRVRVNETLKSGARGNTGDRAQHRLRQFLIAGQFANALILLATAAMFVRSMEQQLARSPGWDHRRILQTVVNLPAAKYPTPDQTYAFFTRVRDRLGALPGVEHVAVGWTLPVFTYLTQRGYVVDGQDAPPPGREPVASVNAVTPSYLPVLGLRVTDGRNFTEADRPGSVPVALINESMARALFPGESAVGRRIGSPDPENRGWLEIVGVVPDTELAIGFIPSSTRFLVYRPLAQETWNYASIAVRGPRPAELTEPVRQALGELDPDLVLQQLGSVQQLVERTLGGFSMVNTLLVGFAGLGLFLAAVGLYGVVAHLVAQRTPEIGVRIALGARSPDIAWMIIRSGLRMTLIGAGAGILGSIAINFATRAALPDTPGTDPVVLAAVTALLIAVALIACWIPSRRAARVDPLVALRSE